MSGIAGSVASHRLGGFVLGGWKSVQRHMAEFQRVDLLILLSLLLVLLYTTDLVAIPAIAGLVYRPIARHPLFWLAVAGLMTVTTIGTDWYRLFNHDYVIAYWALALGLVLWWREPEEILAGTARLIIGFVFLFAVVWKLLSPDFADGSFFQFTLLTDERFQVVGEGIGGVPAGAPDVNREAIAEWREPDVSAPETVRLYSGPTIVALAQGMAIWTLAIEALIALLYLLPGRLRITRLAEPALIAFIISTYVLAPVVGFGWILLILGLATTKLPRRVAHILYPALFLFLQLFRGADQVLAILFRLL